MADFTPPDYIETDTDEESLPQNFMSVPCLSDNIAEGGQIPTIEPTSATEPRSLWTIGNRGA